MWSSVVIGVRWREDVLEEQHEEGGASPDEQTQLDAEEEHSDKRGHLMREVIRGSSECSSETINRNTSQSVPTQMNASLTLLTSSHLSSPKSIRFVSAISTTAERQFCGK